MAKWVEANSGSWVSDFPQLAQPAEDAQHQLLLLYTMGKWRLRGLGLCVHDSFEEFPEEMWQSYPPCVIFLCSRNHFLLHEGLGGKEKKGDNDSKETEGKKDEVQWRMGGSVSVCVSACVCMLISQIGDDDTQQAKINRNPLRWHLSAWSFH